MRFPLSWIKEFVPIEADIETIKEKFTLSGTEIEEILDLDGEIIFDFNFTVNRPDLMSVFGLSREASALFSLPKPKYEPHVEEGEDDIRNFVSIEVQDEKLCPRYMALLIRGVKVGESPPYIQKRLIECGLRPINAVVDATNYVLLEYGHPLHAFDFKYLKGGKIIVRRAREGEIIRLLDGSEKKLNSENLVIADSEKPVAIAGVMGGEDSSVTFTTKDVLLEGALFFPPSIRRTSKVLNIHTDASHRFERGCDYNGMEKALIMAAKIIIENCGGKLCKGSIDIREEIREKRVRLRFERIEKILGIKIEKDIVNDILERLHFEILDKNNEYVEVLVPSFRVDVEREADLIEEVIRVYGLDKLPISLPQLVDIEGGRNEIQKVEKEIRHFLAGRNLNETIHFSTTDPKIDILFAGDKEEIKIVNPLSENNSILRRSLLTNLLTTAIKNSLNGQKFFGLFEIGNIYYKEQNEPKEIPKLAILLYDEEKPKILNQDYMRDFYELKGIAESLFDKFRISYSFREEKPELEIFSENHYLSIVRDGESKGFLGYLDPIKLKKFDVIGKICVLEVDLSIFLESKPLVFKPFSRYPIIKRDMTFVMDKKIKWSDIYSFVLELEPPFLSKVELSQIYYDEKIGLEKKALTLSLFFQSEERTLEDYEVNDSCKKIIEGIEKNFGAVLR